MSRKHLQRIGLRSILAALVLTAVFSLGAAASVLLMPHAVGEHSDHEDDSHADESDPGHEDDHEEEGEHVALTKQAFENLALRMGRVSKGEYWKTLLVPGRVVEIPGWSSLSISASVTGIVEAVDILPGQTLETEKALFSIRITDESLIDAQSKLLELLTKQEVAEQEIARLQPLVQSGAVSGTKVRDLQYELKQLSAQEGSMLQELATRGMPQDAIEHLRESRQLTTLAFVYAPEFTRVSQSGTTATIGDVSRGYSVESLHVHPGMAVGRGDSLCTVAYHPSLYLEGTAFQDDLPILERIANEGWMVTVETHEHDQHNHADIHLPLLRIDNHVDEASQTVKFFLELPNRVSHTRESDGRIFEQWRFRPGQRLHVRLPMERWMDQLTLPADAVVVDGPNVFVFTEHHHDDESEQGEGSLEMATNVEDPDQDEDHDHDVFMELEPVPVRLLYRDDTTVVIADDGQLSSDEEIALNNAYKLYLAMKMQSGGGGGHHHHHDH